MSKIDHNFLDDKNFVLTIASGEIRDKEFIENVSYVRSSERLSDNYACIVDCREMTSFKTATADAIFSASKGVFKAQQNQACKFSLADLVNVRCHFLAFFLSFASSSSISSFF